MYDTHTHGLITITQSGDDCGLCDRYEQYLDYLDALDRCGLGDRDVYQS